MEFLQKNSEREKKQVIDRSTAAGIYSLFNACYKTGVKDAEYVSDKGLCGEFKAIVREPGVYGRVIHNYTMSAREWKLHLLNINPFVTLSKAITEYIILISGRTNFYSCLLPIAQEFYIQGLDDYNNHPAIHDFALFDNSRLERWTRKGIVSRKRREILIDIQKFCFERARIDNDSDSKHAFKGKRYNWFAEAVWAATRGKDFL